ncbi:MAG: hypothetical protein FJ215_10580 [Ignavibacteria bacterium]|nr:hypothetical protein [Ignavibacteria bacterium]
METGTRGGFQRNVFWALILIAAGVLFLLDNFHLLDVGSVGRLWPLIIVAIGFEQLIRSRTPHQRLNACWWLFVGAWIFISYNRVFDLTFRDTWPLLLIAWGVELILRNSIRRRVQSSTER